MAATEPKDTFSATTRAEALKWQRRLRRKFVQRLGGFPNEVCALRPRRLSFEEFPGYTRETLSFTSRAGLTVFAYLLLPRQRSGPLPTLLCLHGHGPGVDPVVGVHVNSTECGDEYHREFGVQAVNHGYAVLAIELLGFGRRCAGTIEGFRGHATCQTLSGTALMLGQTMAGWRVYDAMRAIDYLGTRPEIDPARIGAMGISGGGLNALYLAAVDKRVRATVCSGFLNSFRDSIMPIEHCIDNFVPGLLQDAEMKDIAGLIAPRALWCESGTEDPIFPLRSFTKALREVKHIYGVLEAPDACDGEVFKGGHFFNGNQAWSFLQKYL